MMGKNVIYFHYPDKIIAWKRLLTFLVCFSVQYAIFVFQNIREWRKNPKWSFSCCLALLVPLTNLQSDIRGLAGKNMLKQQVQSGKLGMPSIGATLKESGAIDIAIEDEGDDRESPPIAKKNKGKRVKRKEDPQHTQSSTDVEVYDTSL